MEDQGGATGRKLTGIRQIVRLKEILQKWQAVTLSPKSDGSCSTTHLDHDPNALAPRISITPILNKRLEQVKASCDSDDESIHSPMNPAPDVPKGFLAVYVGEELRRFVIPTDYLKHQLFKVLLEKVEDEFGFDHSGGLTIPCEIETFKYLLKCMDAQNLAKDNPEDESTAETSEATDG